MNRYQSPRRFRISSRGFATLLWLLASSLLGDPAKLGKFEECQQHFSTIVQNMAAQSKSERHISSVATDGGGKGGSLVDKIKGGSYSDEQFCSLSPEEKRRVHKLRDKAMKKEKEKEKQKQKQKQKQKEGKHKCKLEKAKSECDSGSGNEAEPEQPASSSTYNAGA
jgi:hypothetical protein